MRCDELDLMEASQYAFHSVAHRADDGNGLGGGPGGVYGAYGGRYGPAAPTIDTTRPFRVHNAFSSGSLTSITTSTGVALDLGTVHNPHGSPHACCMLALKVSFPRTCGVQLSSRTAARSRGRWLQRRTWPPSTRRSATG